MDEQETFRFADGQDLASQAIKDDAPTRTTKRTVAEDGTCRACRTFSYLCPVCNPR